MGLPPPETALPGLIASSPLKDWTQFLTALGGVLMAVKGVIEILRKKRKKRQAASDSTFLEKGD